VTELRMQAPEWFLPFLQPARYKGAHGGRGSGKSHAFAEYILLRSVQQRTDVVCIREVQRSLQQSVKKLIEMKIEALGLGSFFEIQQTVIKAKTGGVIIFMGMQDHTADSIKSLEGYDLAWVEEAQSLSARSLELLRPTIRKPGSELLFTWNPSGELDPVNALLRGENPPPDAIVREVNFTDNPWFPDVLKQEMEYDRRRDPDKYQHVWMGGYQRNSEARVFRNWRIEEFETEPAWTLRQGADWGFSVDPSVLVQCAIVGRTLYVTHECYRIGCEIDFLPELFRTVPESERWPTTADSARPETISYMQRHGFPKMLAAVKGAKSLEEGIEFLRTFDVVVHPRCKHTIEELTLYSYETDPLTGAILPRLADKDNHVIDSLRYACEGARRAGRATPAFDFSASAAQGARI
jgi:phage terminase large subunit